MCGAGGGVPHYTDYDKHVKLGDVVVSHYGNNQKYEKNYYTLANINFHQVGHKKSVIHLL